MAFSATVANMIKDAVKTTVFVSRLDRADKGTRDNEECLPVYVISPYKHFPLLYPCNHDCEV